jgi:hypothetical protein
MRHAVKERAILALADGRLDPRARKTLEEHLAGCPECRAFHRAVVAGREALRDLGRQSPPPLDWDRVDAGLARKLEERRTEEGRGLPRLVLVGAVAAAAAAAFLLTWSLSRDDGGAPRTGPTEPTVAEGPVQRPGPADRAPAAPPIETFVTFVAGNVEAAEERGPWTPLDLEQEVVEGLRLRTAEQGAAGLQFGPSAGCRIEESSAVSLASIGPATVRIHVDRGRVTCRNDGEDQPIVLSVIDVVASAVGSARWAVHREGPSVVVIELAEGTLRVRRDDAGEVMVTGPSRVALTSGEEGSVERSSLPDDRTAALSSPAIGLLARRAVSSLTIPAVEGLERASVDGVDYGPLPLQLRRLPGRAEVLLYPVGGGDPVSREVAVAFGPTILGREELLAALTPRTPEPTERRVAPRYGTMDAEQVARVRTLVGGRVRSCYERTLRRYPNVWGRILVRFTVATNGETQSVSVSSVAGGHPAVNECVQSALSAERFPTPRGGSVPIEQTITLAPRF